MRKKKRKRLLKNKKKKMDIRFFEAEPNHDFHYPKSDIRVFGTGSIRYPILNTLNLKQKEVALFLFKITQIFK